MEWETGTTEVATGVYAYVQATGGFCVANAGLIAGARGTTVIDALFTPPMTRALLDEAARINPQPVERLINTHHHVDHTLGNALFPATTEIVAHARARAEMQRTGMGVLDVIKRMAPHFAGDLEGAGERLPDVTFDGETLEFEIDMRAVRLIHFGTAHTRGDVLAHLPAERILFTGDIGFFSVTPLAFEGHIGRWISVGRRIVEEIDADVLVPGHGPVGTKGELEVMLGYLRLVRDGARVAFDAGASEQEAVASLDLGEYAGWTDAERVVPNVSRCFQEFRGELDDVMA